MGDNEVSGAGEAERRRALLPHVEKTLDTVSKLTEYQDEKANRIFTAMAFLSALAALSYTELSKRLDAKLWSGNPWFHRLFFAYAVTLVFGALLVLSGIAPYFEIPDEWKERRPTLKEFFARIVSWAKREKPRSPREPQSVLFYELIARLDKNAWTTYFDRDVAALEKAYFDSYVFESLLVAKKIPRKMKRLKVGVTSFKLSTACLLAWFVVAAADVHESRLSEGGGTRANVEANTAARDQRDSRAVGAAAEDAGSKGSDAAALRSDAGARTSAADAGTARGDRRMPSGADSGSVEHPRQAPHSNAPTKQPGKQETSSKPIQRERPDAGSSRR